MIIPEKILKEIVKSILKEDAQKKLLDKIKDLKSKIPTTGSFSDNPFNHIPTSPDEALRKITYVQEFILYKTRLCYYLDISERTARKKQTAAEKKADTYRDENECLKTENQRLKIQLQKLIGIKKKKSSESGNSQKDKSPVPTKVPKKRGAPKGHRGNTRQIPDKIDRTIDIDVYHQCGCGSHNIDKRSDYDSKYIEEIEFKILVTEKKYRRGQCLDCGCMVRHPDALKGPPVSIGNNTAAMLASMRQLMGCSYRKLSLFFTEYFNFPLEPSGVLGIVNRSSDSVEPIYSGLGEVLRNQNYLNGDETGWKNNGKRWQLWCFCNPSMAYYHADPSRSSEVPKKILGEDFSGTVNCDFYGSYNFLSKTQRCLIHFQRDIHDEMEVNSRDKNLRLLKQCIDEVINAGKEIKANELKGKKLRNKAEMIEQRLKEAGEIKAKPETRTATLVKRINVHKEDLSRFAYDPNIDFHNNRAEQMIRPAVIFRKISFGNRSVQGALRYSMLSTVIQTMRLQKKNVFSYLKKILDTSPEQRYNLVKEFDSS